MLYFIKSPDWSNHYKKETWWGPNRNGYTCFLADAGVYTEDDRLLMEERNSRNKCLFVPITSTLLKKAMKQLKEKDESLAKEKIRITDCYISDMIEIKNDVAKNIEKISNMSTLANELACQEG